MGSDKYPDDTDRRRFVRGVVGGAALAGIASGGTTTVDSLTNPSGGGGGVTEYYGIENVAGPAPRAMPQIPVNIDDEGYLSGVFPEVSEKEVPDGTVAFAEREIADISYKPDWFQYCGVQTYPGVQPGDRDEYFRYAEDAPYAWQGANVEAGAKMHVDDFSDYASWGNEIGRGGLGKPARGTWRSEDASSRERIPIEVIRSSAVDKLERRSRWLRASTEEGFIAYLDKCTHFCCLPGFKETPQSGKEDAADLVYCSCHQSVYDPFSIVRQSFTALPRPE